MIRLYGSDDAITHGQSRWVAWDAWPKLSPAIQQAKECEAAEWPHMLNARGKVETAILTLGRGVRLRYVVYYRRVSPCSP